ncbi:MAG TPA: hypothetical protein VFO57_05460, partial [Burkholderiales bacterium]|nr:hypothetical protein [Burkholderiales bacterium]
AGCAAMDCTPQGAPPGAGAAQEKTPAGESQPAAPKQGPAIATQPVHEAPKRDRPMAAEPAPPVAASANRSAAQPQAPTAQPPVKVAEAPAPSAPASKKENAAPAAAKPAPKKEGAAPVTAKPAPMDLTLLEKRLKETPAIGVFTKLTLKNQVDDLLDQFKAYYQGRAKVTLAALRQPYDQLILKVLSLLQDSDPPLARAIMESREAIWGILSDPEKFKNL